MWRWNVVTAQHMWLGSDNSVAIGPQRVAFVQRIVTDV
jgi:hypothetical protein